MSYTFEHFISISSDFIILAKALLTITSPSKYNIMKGFFVYILLEGDVKQNGCNNCQVIKIWWPILQQEVDENGWLSLISNIVQS